MSIQPCHALIGYRPFQWFIVTSYIILDWTCYIKRWVVLILQVLHRTATFDVVEMFFISIGFPILDHSSFEINRSGFRVLFKISKASTKIDIDL